MQHFSLNGFDVRFFESNEQTIWLLTDDVNKAMGFEGDHTSFDNASQQLKYIPISESFTDTKSDTLVIDLKNMLRVITRSSKNELKGLQDILAQMLVKGFIQNFGMKENLPALPAATDTDRVQKLATTAANRYQPSDVPKDAIKLPGWLTVSEMLISIGEDPTAEFALIKDNNFRYWINRQMSDIYRAQFGDEPPTVQRKHGSGYCYPKIFVSLVTLYRSNWLAINS